jgi:hypothetical protein
MVVSWQRLSACPASATAVAADVSRYEKMAPAGVPAVRQHALNAVNEESSHICPD